MTDSWVFVRLRESSFGVVLGLLLIEFGTGLTRAVRLVRIAGRVRLRHGGDCRGSRLRGACVNPTLAVQCVVSCAALVECSGRAVCAGARCGTATRSNATLVRPSASSWSCAHPNHTCTCTTDPYTLPHCPHSQMSAAQPPIPVGSATWRGGGLSREREPQTGLGAKKSQPRCFCFDRLRTAQRSTTQRTRRSSGHEHPHNRQGFPHSSN